MRSFMHAIMLAMLLTTTLGLFACDSSAEPAATSQPPDTAIVSTNAAGQVTVNKPWIRATAPGQTVSGAFMRLDNNSATPFALTSVSFSGAKTVEIHESSMADGMMRMRQVDRIEIPANGSAELKPGSYHVMLIGLDKQMKPGTTETLTLTFSDGSEKSVEALVGAVSEPHTHE